MAAQVHEMFQLYAIFRMNTSTAVSALPTCTRSRCSSARSSGPTVRLAAYTYVIAHGHRPPHISFKAPLSRSPIYHSIQTPPSASHTLPTTPSNPKPPHTQPKCSASKLPARPASSAPHPSRARALSRPSRMRPRL
jgi:hypothetical protein